MKREKNLFKNTIIITIGKVSTQLITFLLLPLYTGVLSTKEYGVVDLITTLITLLLPIITFQIEQAVFRELIEIRGDYENSKKIITTTFFTVVLQCVLYSILFVLISPLINNDYKVFLVTNVITYIFLSLFLQIARGLGDNKRYALASIVTSFFTIFFNILFLVIFKLGANGMLLGTLIGQFIGIMYLFFRLHLYRYIKYKTYEKILLKKLWKYSLPLIPNALSWWVFNASDRLIVSGFLGVEQNGILAASLKFSTIIITLYNIYNLSWTESISVNINDDDIDHYFCKMFNMVMKLFISLCLGMIACMPFVYPLLINEKFNSGYNLIPISIVGCIFNVVVGLISAIYIAKKNTKAVAGTSIISALINIIVHLSLIKFVGLYAAVISTLVSFAVMSLYRIIDIKKKYFKINIDFKMIIYSTLMLLLVLTSFYINNNILNIACLLIVIMFSLVSNRNLIKSIINTKPNIIHLILKITKFLIIAINIIAVSVLFYYLFIISILPMKLLILIIILIASITIISIILLLMKKRVLVIIGLIIMIMNITISLGAIYYLNVTNKFLNNSFNSEIISYTNDFYIVSLNNPKYNDKKIDKVGYYIDTPNIEKIKNNYNKYQYTEYITLNSLFDDLGNEVNYIIIEKATYELFFQIMTEYNIYNYQVVKEINLEIKEPIVKKDNIITNNNNINIYIGGTDFTKTYYDFNLILTINPDNHKILLTSIPRDFYIPVAGKGKKDILGYHGVYGINTSIASIENMLDINIDYYIKITTNSLVNIVDTLGGLEYCSNKEFTTTHAKVLDTYIDNGERMHVKEGCEYYNGIEILTIARERKAFAGGDRDRQKNCQKIVISLFNKMASPSNLLKYSDILNALSDFYITNIPRELITDTVKDMIDHGNHWQFSRQSLNGYDSNGYVHLSNIKDYVMVPYQSTINSCKIKIKSL